MGRPPPNPLAPPPPPMPPAGNPPEAPRAPSRWPSWRPSYAKRLRGLWPLLAALASGAATTWGSMETALQRRIDASIETHDQARDAHPDLTKRIKNLEEQEEEHLKDYVELRTRVSLAEKRLQKAYWWLVGYKAADLERDNRRKSEAARTARERFLKYIHEGQSVEEAYQLALPSATFGW